MKPSELARMEAVYLYLTDEAIRHGEDGGCLSTLVVRMEAVYLYLPDEAIRPVEDGGCLSTLVARTEAVYLHLWRERRLSIYTCLMKPSDLARTEGGSMEQVDRL